MMDDQEGNKTRNRSPQREINRVSVKLPPCWTENITLWFIQAEAQFSNARIRDDNTKYYTIVAALDAEALKIVSDIVIGPPDDEKYQTLKSTLINRLQDSEEKRLTTLLTRIQLADKKPSELLRHMKELAGPGLAESKIIKTLWLQRLPQQVQAIISAVPDDDLNTMARTADKILEVYARPEGDRVEYRTETQNYAPPSSSSIKLQDTGELLLIAMQKQIELLSDEVRKLKLNSGCTHTRHAEQNYSHRRSDTRSNQNRKYRSSSRSKSREHSSNGYCSYHQQFGNRAYRCIKPCKFESVQSGNDQGRPM